MKTLIFDTETTGLHNPYIVQLAAVLFNDREPVSQMSVIVKPADEEGNVVCIPDEVEAIHGISNKLTDCCGIEMRNALMLFLELFLVSDRIVAHNLRFDRDVLFREMHRNFKLEEVTCMTSVFGALPAICTMSTAMPICKIPKKNGYGFKRPKLAEAHKFFLDTDFDGAHNALNDVNACARILWAMEDVGARLVEV